MTIQLATLPNGIRVLTDTVTSVESVALGAFFAVGTRNEEMRENGLAHLVEHMLFKGTTKRTARDIAEEVEGIGGHMNAYTSREVTGYYFHVIKDHVPLVLDVLADMMQNSTYAQDELERERQVILQEIGMNADTPDELLFDHYQECAFPGQTLGAPILGTAEIVSTMPREAIMAYVKKFYTPHNLVISAAGHIDHDDFVKQVTALFNDLPDNQIAGYPHSDYKGGDIRTEKELEQAHVLFGFKGIKRSHPGYYDMVAMAHILGGGMSSRLFQEIRENRGLAYNIYSFHSTFRDDGVFGIYAGTGGDRLKELMDTLVDELKKFAASVTELDVDRTKKQLKASLLMGRESMSTRADQNAKHLLYHNRVLDTDDLRRRIDQISIKGVTDLATSTFSGVPTIAAIGPLAQLPSYADIQQKLKA